MADIHEFPDIPGYVSIKQAALMLGITDKRVYQYIEIGRLPAYKASGVFLLSEEDVKQFKLNPPGRLRTSPPRWRSYSSRSKVLTTEIQVPVRMGMQEELLQKLAAIQDANRHTFPGTIARYLIKGDEALTCVHIVLLWKDTDMPDETTRQHDLETLQDELADMLDWETAHATTNETLLYT
jgi:excisionase family DNA binding protein